MYYFIFKTLFHKIHRTKNLHLNSKFQIFIHVYFLKILNRVATLPGNLEIDNLGNNNLEL